MKKVISMVIVLMASICLCNAMESEERMMKSLSKEDQKDLKYLRRLAKSETMEDSTWAKDVKVFGYSRSEGVEDWGDIDPTFGVAYYWDVDVDCMAYYAQIPIVKYRFIRINFGIIVPVGKDEITDHSYYYEWKTRPEFSVSCLWGEMLELPSWMPLETGAYVAVGAYSGMGLQLGLLRIVF